MKTNYKKGLVTTAVGLVFICGIGFIVFKFFEFMNLRNNCLASSNNKSYEIDIFIDPIVAFGDIEAYQKNISGISPIMQFKIITAEEAFNSFAARHKELEETLGQTGKDAFSSEMKIILSGVTSASEANNIQKKVEQRAQELGLPITKISNNFQLKGWLSEKSSISFDKYLTDSDQRVALMMCSLYADEQSEKDR